MSWFPEPGRMIIYAYKAASCCRRLYARNITHTYTHVPANTCTCSAPLSLLCRRRRRRNLSMFSSAVWCCVQVVVLMISSHWRTECRRHGHGLVRWPSIRTPVECGLISAAQTGVLSSCSHSVCRYWHTCTRVQQTVTWRHGVRDVIVCAAADVDDVIAVWCPGQY